MTQSPFSNNIYLTPTLLNIGSVVVVFLLVLASLSVGVADFSWHDMFAGLLGAGSGSDTLFWVSRLPRTLAIILAGIAMSISGMMMQVVLKNRFVEPSMVGATQSAALGMLLVSIWAPGFSVFAKMSVAALVALFGMLVFMRLLKRLPATDYLMIPLVGIVFSGIIEAITTFIAYQTETLQLLSVWQFGDFSGILAGRYETLWITGVLCVIAYIIADKLTIIGLGDNIALNLGVNRQAVLWSAIGMVAMMSALVVSTVGVIPFVGLVVPNIISRLMGDKLKKTLPAVALFGAAAVLICDILGRTIRYPFEIPVATVFGVLGALVFLVLLFKNPR